MKLEVLDLLSRKREKEERDLSKGHRESERFMVEIHSSGPRLVFLHVLKSEISSFFFFFLGKIVRADLSRRFLENASG